MTRHDALVVSILETVDGTSIVAVSGELDVASSDLLASVLTSFGDLPDVKHVNLDVSDLEFIDAKGLSTIIGADQMLRERTGAVVSLTGAHGSVLRMLEITHTERFVRSHHHSSDKAQHSTS